MKVAVIGAGLAGSMVASLFSKFENVTIILFEKRDDPRMDDSMEHLKSPFGASVSATKRSINLALSYRGMLALEEVNLLETVMKSAIRMPGRVILNRNGSTVKQAYGKPKEAIYSVGRQDLNYRLLDMLDRLSNVTIKFHHILVDVYPDGKLIGADGAYSMTRESILRKGRINFSRSYISHGYKELSIPPKIASNGTTTEYALVDYEGLHIWPRGKFMMIALPNPDHSFTATLFAPYKGVDGFEMIESLQQHGEVMNYFQRHFPDLIPIMPNIEQDFKENPVGSLLTVRVNPWNLGKVVLIGDAAHAIVPFYGQGMNAAFEDGYILYNLFKSAFHMNLSSSSSSSTQSINVEGIIEQFASDRRLATDCLADLCIEHYDDMASNTASGIYLLKKKFYASIASFLSGYFLPLYSMIAFNNIPYHIAVERARKQEQILSFTIFGIGSILSIASFMGIYRIIGEGRGSKLFSTMVHPFKAILWPRSSS